MGKLSGIEAYNVKTKEKEEMQDAVIDKNGNRYFAKGLAAAGNKMCVAMGKEKAEAAIKAKKATKGEGW
jgi:hypothetical protein